MNKLCFRPRPIKIVLRLTTTGSHPNFRLPYQGWWAITSTGGGGGSGATHISYADPSEHGYNAQYQSVSYTYRKTLTVSPVIGAAGVGGTVTNNSDITSQRGKDGDDTLSGTGSTRAGGNGGKCAFEQTGLSPTQPSANYPANTYDTRAVTGTFFCGVPHSAGGVTAQAGRGAAGKTSPAQAGEAGTNGRADYYCKG